MLVAYWSITETGKTAEHQFAESAALEGAGYEALVAAEKQLLANLAQAIAQGVQ